MKSWIRICLIATVLLAMAATGDCADGVRPKSISKALLFSFLMPGAGQQYLGNTGRARMMYVAEAGVWTAFTGFRIQGSMREDRYKEMARLFAGVEHQLDDDYCIALAHYASSEDYNIDVMREARFLYPDDREKQLAYFEENGYFGADGWEWESLEKQEEFERTRTRSRESYRRAVLTTGFAVLNRVVSMIDVYLSFKLAGGDGQSSYPSLRVEKGPDESLRLYFSTPF